MPSTHAEIRLAEPKAVLHALVEHMSEHDVNLCWEDGGVRAEMDLGEARIALREDALLMKASAASEDALGEVAAFLASHVREFARPDTPTIRWAGLSGARLLPDFRIMTLSGVEDLTPHMRRLTLRGDNLERFASERDLHVRLFFPKSQSRPAWPMRSADGLIVPVAPGDRPDMRKYTIRRIDLSSASVEIDFVLHDDAGPGSAFAARARPGDRLGMAGPGGRTARPAEWMLLVGDETALPAIARIAEGLPASTRGTILLEVERPCERIALTAPKGFEVRWLERQSGAVPLLDAVRGIAIPATGTRCLWAGAEFATIQAIRSHWKNHAGIEKDEQLAVAYWKRGEPGR